MWWTDALPCRPRMTTTPRTVGVDLSGLLRVLGDHLYSTPTVAVNELVQNAHDSILRRRLEVGAAGGSIRVDVGAGRLVVTDDGSGLTEQEIIDHLATVGTGYTGSLRQQTGDDGLVGVFGLGFLSAFVIADHVELRTTSYQGPLVGWLYRSRDGQRFSLEEVEAGSVGTQVTLFLKDRFRHLADLDVLHDVLLRYAIPLSVPVLLGDRVINREPPPWRDPDTVDRSLAFATAWETRFSPVCVMPVGETEASDARGFVPPV